MTLSLSLSAALYHGERRSDLSDQTGSPKSAAAVWADSLLGPLVAAGRRTLNHGHSWCKHVFWAQRRKRKLPLGMAPGPPNPRQASRPPCSSEFAWPGPCGDFNHPASYVEDYFCLSSFRRAAYNGDVWVKSKQGIMTTFRRLLL